MSRTAAGAEGRTCGIRDCEHERATWAAGLPIRFEGAMKTIDLLRHTANDGDLLTPQGIRQATDIGGRLTHTYSLVVSSGAQRATQTAACVLAGLASTVPGGVIVVEELRSDVEERWRVAYRAAGAGDLESLRNADPDLVATDSKTLASGLRRILELLGEDERALAVGHSPTNEAAIYGLTGVIVAPMDKGQAITISHTGDGFLIDDR